MPTRPPPFPTLTAAANSEGIGPAGDASPADALTGTRAIRSYVVRAGRITPAQERALKTLWPIYGVDLDTRSLELLGLFGRSAPCTLEIGFGNGDNLLARAAREPGRDFLGIEVHRPGVGHLLLEASRAGLSNLRVIVHDAVEVLQKLPAAALEEVQVLFPDPWPKKRHHKRRLLQPELIARLVAVLQPGGRLHIVTDWQAYAEQIAADLAACEALTDAANLPDLIVSARTATRFERRGARLGHGIYEFLQVRRA